MKWLLVLLLMPVFAVAGVGSDAALSFGIVYTSAGIAPVHYAVLSNEETGRVPDTDCMGYVVNDSISFSHTDTGRSVSKDSRMMRLNLLDEASNLIGHMELNRKLDDKGQSPSIEGFLIVGDRHTPCEPEWDFYSDGEHMVSMLVRPTRINPSRKPLLLVHGIGGTYPYFGAAFTSQLNAAPQHKDMFDIWQFYYPYNQQIEQNAPMLGKALELIQACGYPQNEGRVNVLAHSMGGLVTRALIQDINPGFKYRHNIGKLCLLGTPNHGSHCAFRIGHPKDYPFLWALNELFTHHDERSPAMRQLYPGSSFLTELNSRPPSPLYPGSDPKNSYLVVAGIHNPYYPWEAESSLEQNDDSLVALASASLLDFGIPLATVPHSHAELAGRGRILGSNLDPAFLADFFSDSHIQKNPGFKAKVAGFWTSPPDKSSAPLGSIICIRISESAIETTLNVIMDTRSRTIQLTPATVDKAETELPKLPGYSTLIPCETSGGHSATYTFMENEPLNQPVVHKIINTKFLACPLDPGSYRVELYGPQRQLLWSRDAYLELHNGCTSYLDIGLTPDPSE